MRLLNELALRIWVPPLMRGAANQKDFEKPVLQQPLLNHMIQSAEAEVRVEEFVARMIKEAEARGCKVTILGDEILIEEPPHGK